jgi:hypothetical protein
MLRRLMVVTSSVVCLAWAAGPASGAVEIGQSTQGNVQGDNSTQSGINGTSGTTQVLGDSTPVLTQDSANLQANLQAADGADSTLIANGPGAGFGQLNNGAINSSQTGVNGDSGTGLATTTATLHQSSLNVIAGEELLAAGPDNVVIGASNQLSNAGVNSAQSGNDFPGGSPILGQLEQFSANFLGSEIILGS